MVVFLALEINFFNSMEHLEPECPGCKVKIEYGVNTQYDEAKKVHLCVACGAVIK